MLLCFLFLFFAFAAYVAMHGEVGGNERYGNADKKDYCYQNGIGHKMAWVEQRQMELLVENVNGGKHQHGTECSAKKTIQYASP